MPFFVVRRFVVRRFVVRRFVVLRRIGPALRGQRRPVRLGVGRLTLFAPGDPLELGPIRGDLVLQYGGLCLALLHAPSQLALATAKVLILLQLRAALPGVTVTVSELRTDPWDFLVVQ